MPNWIGLQRLKISKRRCMLINRHHVSHCGSWLNKLKYLLFFGMISEGVPQFLLTLFLNERCVFRFAFLCNYVFMSWNKF